MVHCIGLTHHPVLETPLEAYSVLDAREYEDNDSIRKGPGYIVSRKLKVVLSV